MIGTLPNPHPLIVPFPIALTLSATLFALAALLARNHPLATAWRTVGRWSLWLAAASAIPAVFAGLLAFNSVDHDDLSHAAMIEHRAWALASVAVLLAVAAWEGARVRGGERFPGLTVLLFAAAATVVAITAGLGSELVYGHGLGVRRLPTAAAAPAVSVTPAAATPSAAAAKPPEAVLHSHKGHAHAHPH